MSNQHQVAWGRRLRRIRRERELTATDVARDAGISRQYLHMLERGEHQPSQEVRSGLAKAIGLETGAFDEPVEVAS